MSPATVEGASAGTMVELHWIGVGDLRRRWGWFMAMGILLMLLGVAAVESTMNFTKVFMVVVGWLMIAGGVLQMIHAFACRRWSGFFIDLVSGILYAVVGLMIEANPEATAVVLTLLIAMFLIFSGIFRMVLAATVRYQHWIWLFLHGAVAVTLGTLIWRGWPWTGLWAIGLYIGIDMIFNGWTLVMLALAARHLREPQGGK